MRPRLNAGDDLHALEWINGDGYASMRPRLNAGDDAGRSCRPSPSTPRFNEAPAKCRG